MPTVTVLLVAADTACLPGAAVRWTEPRLSHDQMLGVPPITVFNWGCGLFLAVVFTMGSLGLVHDLMVDPISVLQRLTQVVPRGLWDYVINLIWHTLLVGWGVFWIRAVLLDLEARLHGHLPVLTRREWMIGGAVLVVSVWLLIEGIARR